MKKILKGFTLAEVLITLSIIGIISAITLPSLQSNIQNQTLEPQISKFYSQMEEGLKRYMATEGIETLPNDATWITPFVRNYLRVEYVCTGSDDTNCYADSYKSLNGRAVANFGRTMLRLRIILSSNIGVFGGVLKDGATFTIYRFGGISRLVFDVNGKRGPNILGRDLFTATISNNGILNEPTADMYDNPANYNQTLITNYNNCRIGNNILRTDGCLQRLARNKFKFDY